MCSATTTCYATAPVLASSPSSSGRPAASSAGLRKSSEHQQPQAPATPYSPRSPFPIVRQTIHLDPLLKAAMRGATRTDAGHVQGMPWVAGAEDKAEGIHGSAVIDAGPMTPSKMPFACRELRHDVLPQTSGMRQPSSLQGRSMVIAWERTAGMG